MNNNFSNDFNNYLKTTQPSPIRYYIIGFITLAFMLFMEYGFYSPFTQMTIVKCSLPNQFKNSSLDNCFLDQVPECLYEEFHTESKYSLVFPISILGFKSDKFSILILALSLVCFIFEVCLYLLLDYTLYLKKKRTQNVLANSMIFVDGKKKNENGFTIFLLIDLAIYTALKFVWVYWRNHQYSEFTCGGNLIHLTFGTSIGNSISTIILLVVTYIFFPLLYFFTYFNLLSDLDFKNMMSHLSYDTVKQFKYITVLDVQKYQDIIDDYVQDKYSDRSFLTRFFKSHTFTFSTTSDEEICQILLDYKSRNPHHFEPMLYNEPKILINDDSRDDGSSVPYKVNNRYNLNGSDYEDDEGVNSNGYAYKENDKLIN